MAACLGLFATLALTRPLAAQSLRPPGYSMVSAEFMSLTEIESALPLLASYQVGVVLEWPAGAVDQAARIELVRAAQSRGVQVAPWLLLPQAQGYWPNATNAAAYDTAARALLRAWVDAGLRPSTLIVDMEMPLARSERYTEITLSGDLSAMRAFLREGIDRAQYAAATRIYRELVEYAHGLGFKVDLSTLSQVLDDYADGDDDIRQAFNVPVDDIPWDLVGIQAYRTLNEYALGERVGATTAYYVYDYARRARQVFGARACVIVGMTDPGDLTADAPVYASGEQLREDLDAARAAGLPRERVQLYNLRGITRRAPSDQWFARTSLLARIPRADVATLLTRAATAVLDTGL